MTKITVISSTLYNLSYIMLLKKAYLSTTFLYARHLEFQICYHYLMEISTNTGLLYKTISNTHLVYKHLQTR